MYVCVCRAINEKDLKKAYAQGLDSLPELRREMGLGTGCGSCVNYTLELLKGMHGVDKAEEIPPAKRKSTPLGLAYSSS